MRVTIVPTGFEGFGDAISRGMSEGYAQKMKDKEKKEMSLSDLLTLEALKRTDVISEEGYNTFLSQYDKKALETMASQATQGQPSGQVVPPQGQPQGIRPPMEVLGSDPRMGRNAVRPPVSPMEAMMAKTTNVKTDAMAAQEAYDEKQKKTKISGAELWKASEQERQKTLSETFGKTARAITALSNLVGYGKAVDEDIKVPEMLKGFSGAYRGAVGELGSFRYASDKLQKETKSAQAYRAQVSDILTSLTPIMSGQARWVQGLAEVVLKSIPNLSRTTEVRDEIVAQTARSMLSLSFAVENGFLTDDIAKRFGIDKDTGELTVGQAEDVMKLIDRSFLTKDQEEQIEMAVDFILNTPAIRQGKIEGQGETDTPTQPTSGWSDEKENRLQELRKKLGR